MKQPIEFVTSTAARVYYIFYKIGFGYDAFSIFLLHIDIPILWQRFDTDVTRLQ